MHRACHTILSSIPPRPVSSVGKLTDLVSHLSLNSDSASTKNGNSSLINHESRRFGRTYRKWYRWPNDFLPFKWERPVTDPPYLRTGDAVRDIGLWDPKSMIPGAEHSKALESAPESVRRMFTLEFAERKTVVEYQKRKIIDHIQQHPFDNQSSEVKIARYTINIRNNLHHFTKIDKYDAPRKIRQNAFMFKRNKLLKLLFWQDRERYDYVIRLLGITHTVPKLGEWYEKPSRKGELRRLTKEYCDKIKEDRLTEYHNELKAKRATLDEDMAKIEKLIKEEEKYLGTQNPAPSSQPISQ